VVTAFVAEIWMLPVGMALMMVPIAAYLLTSASDDAVGGEVNLTPPVRSP